MRHYVLYAKYNLNSREYTNILGVSTDLDHIKELAALMQMGDPQSQYYWKEIPVL